MNKNMLYTFRCKIKLLFVILVCNFNFLNAQNVNLNCDIESLYNLFNLKSQNLSYQVFETAISGYFKIAQKSNWSNPKITIIDYTLPSTEKRLWILDLEKFKVLFHTFVAHGRNTGENIATYFSNDEKSFKSSLGFYVTGNTYIGKHNYSLYLNGLEKGINDKARQRAVVLHGAEYVSQKYIKMQGRLGRSLGCPAVPVDESKPIIDAIKNGSCLFMYHKNYLKLSSQL